MVKYENRKQNYEMRKVKKKVISHDKYLQSALNEWENFKQLYHFLRRTASQGIPSKLI